MAIRVRLDMTWTIDQPVVGLPDASLQDHASYAERVLVSFFPHCHAALRTKSGTISETRAEIRMLWDINLDMVFGRFSEPQDFADFAREILVDALVDFAPTLYVQIWRKADLSEAIDHAEIISFYGADATRDDYPVFRPEPHPDWEEADEVFMQDGAWFWCVSDEMKHLLAVGEMDTPSVGPDPEAIYSPWEDDYFDRIQARAGRMDELRTLAA
ncbi:hypothetical protein ACOI1H_25270 [Loktanella sp. DJP18]|uniref:hypothetical protein n=1 Tax=Loktanella sp. DJP18 TaxID=3409788 RepID=UPI003BB6A3C9